MGKVVVCSSVHHGNTEKIARVISSVLGAHIIKPEDIDPEKI